MSVYQSTFIVAHLFTPITHSQHPFLIKGAEIELAKHFTDESPVEVGDNMIV